MEVRKNVVDVSCFFLFEDTGDSEDSDASMASIDHADDDAESCSYDSSDYSPCVSEVQGSCDVQMCVDIDVDDDDDDEEEEGEEVHSYTKWPNEQHKGLPRNHKSGVSDSEELVIDMDDRLFWETCLAS